MDATKKQQQQQKLILQVLAHIRTHQFTTMSMEDMAKLMNISRATLYKYFINKEDIFNHFTNGFIQYIEKNRLYLIDEEEKIITNFILVLEQSTLLALLVPHSFLKQLKDMYPEMYNRLTTVLEERDQQTISFYQFGTKKGYFRNLNPALIIQQQQLYETWFDMKFLMKNNLSIHQVLWDFYQLQKEQLLFEKYDNLFDEDLMKHKIDYLSKKISDLLFN
ncbi:TetR/AcrR family transcriptional regulator [Kurthia sibirica]|uniref:HTH tetR-type domain-containing protein n=1 Tax=Kurthia sibirica TaxID=202750 RepID=A0A2U3APB5_9BACL|nr:TetR/AcrR family transcriptional regulator [Kurthia sibirica]PWI26382.1 hypothetical protein DEX24_03330 [Kurthia sibirica]GEK34183.1 TetR family transcriptional regulator [Kurthia sibirica]